MAHDRVEDSIVDKVYERVQNGMGLIVLHSGHASKIFQKLMGTRSDLLKWREADEKERLWVIDHSHPIVAGLGEYIELEAEEMYGEAFHIPPPDELIFITGSKAAKCFAVGPPIGAGKAKYFTFDPGTRPTPRTTIEKYCTSFRTRSVGQPP